MRDIRKAELARETLAPEELVMNGWVEDPGPYLRLSPAPPLDEAAERSVPWSTRSSRRERVRLWRS